MSMILKRAEAIEVDIIAFRRELHRHAELSGREFETQKKIAEALDELGIPYRKVGSTSLIATLKGSKPGRTVALRADIDALPIMEEAAIDFVSENTGVMHACGHDAHAAMLLGAARLLSEMKDDIKGEVRFFFQEGEENFTGAKKIVAAGGMEGVDACFGMHGMNSLKTGQIGISPGYRLSGSDFIHLKFEGVSGHAATPHLARDTIHPAAEFVTTLQGIVTKNVSALEPVVLSVGRFQGGTQANIVSKFTEIDISMRYFSSEARDTIHEAIHRHAKAIADAYEIKVAVDIETGTYSVRNDESLSLLAIQSAEAVMGPGSNIDLPMAMNSEDMSYYLREAPGVYAFIGYYNEEKGSIYSPHHERFTLDEAYFKYGCAMHVQFALDFLNAAEDKTL